MHKKFLRNFVGLGAALTLLSSFFVFSPFLTGSASAALSDEIKSAVFLDADQIRIDWNNGRVTLLKDNDTNDDTFRYTGQSNDHSCNAEIEFQDSSPTDGIDNLLEYYFANQGSSITVDADLDMPRTREPNGPDPGCQNFGEMEDLTVSNFGASRVYFVYVDSGTIRRMDNNGNQVYERSTENPSLYFRTSDGDPENDECVDYIQLTGDGSTYRLFDIDPNGGGPEISGEAPSGAGCNYNDNGGDSNHIYGYLGSDGRSRATALPMGNTSEKPANINEVSPDEEGDIGNGNQGDDGPSCESEGGVMSWILCPAIFLADSIIRWLDEAITSLLETPNDYFVNPELEAVWSRLRNIAYIILVPIALVMVISTALGFDFVSAYTVKRALPRMVMAVLFIALSFEITKFLVIFTNNVGNGLSGLISTAVAGTNDITLASIFSPDGGDSATGVAIGAIGVGAALTIGSIGILFSYLLIMLIGLLVAFFLLSFRQLLIIALMVLAPLAILAWIFPGNDKLWKLWWETFSKLLMLFPIIMVLIAAGRVFAHILSNVDSSFATTLIKLIAYVGPFFLIPAMFKFAGGLFATVSGMANDRSRGLFDRQKKYRGQKMGQNWQDTKNFNRFKGQNRMSRAANTALGYGSNVNRAGVMPTKWRGRLGAARSDMDIHGREAMLEDKEYTWKGNDGLNKAATQSRNEADLRRILRDSGDYADTASGRANMERDVAKVERMRKKYGTSAFRQAAWLSAVAGGTAYDTGEDSDNAWQDAAMVAGQDDSLLADLVAKGRSAAMGAGRVDQGGAGFGDTFTIARQFRDNPNFGGTRGANQGRADLARRVYDSQGGGVLVHSSMKLGAVEALAPEMVRSVDTAVNSGNTTDAARSLASLAAVYDGMAASSPEKARAIAEGVMGQTLDVGEMTPETRDMLSRAINVYDDQGNLTAQNTHITIQRAIEAMRANPEFVQMRREYSSQIEGQQRLPQSAPGGPPTGAPTDLPGGHS